MKSQMGRTDGNVQSPMGGLYAGAIRYDGIFGLSCIENHVLAVLRQRGEEIDDIYYNCAVPLQELYRHMVIDGVKQEYFSLVERIQDVLKRMGVIELVRVTSESFCEAGRAVRRCGEDEYILIRVTPDFTKSVLLARGFREDHYVYARPCGSGFEIFNDIPERILKLTFGQLQKGYGSEYFQLSVKRKLNQEDISSLWEMRSFKPACANCMEYGQSGGKVCLSGMQSVPWEVRWQKNGLDAFSQIKDIGIRLRNLAGVYKVLRYRMAKYYGRYIDAGFIWEAMPQVEKIYTMLEYCNLRPGTPIGKYVDLYERLYHIDSDLMARLIKKMEE